MAESGELLELEGSTGFLEKVSGAALIALGLGFFIESYFDAKFGVTYLNLLHSRMAFTGIGFLLQVGLIVISLTAESHWSISSTHLRQMAAQSQNSAQTAALWIAYSISWLAEVVVLGTILRATFAFSWESLRSAGAIQNTGPVATATAHLSLLHLVHDHLPELLAGLAVFAVLSVRDYMRGHPDLGLWSRTAAAFAVVVGSVVFAFSEFSIHDKLLVEFIGYVLLIRAAYALYHSSARLSLSDKRLAFFAVAFMVPPFYAQFIYPNVLPQWGGAAKAKLWIRFQHDMIPFGVTSPAFLLEETEQGYYLLRSDTEEQPSPIQTAQRAAQCQSGEETGRTTEASSHEDDEAEEAQDASPRSEAAQCAQAEAKQVRGPALYSAVFVPRREVTQVIYQRSLTGE